MFFIFFIEYYTLADIIFLLYTVTHQGATLQWPYQIWHFI